MGYKAVLVKRFPASHSSSRLGVPGAHSQLKANDVLLSIPSSQEVSVFPGKWYILFANR